MEFLVWCVVLYFVGRRWLKKHPEKKAALVAYLDQNVGTKHPTPRHDHPHTHATIAGAHKPQPVLRQRKKSEKQFQEL